MTKIFVDVIIIDNINELSFFCVQQYFIETENKNAQIKSKPMWFSIESVK